MTLTLEKEFRPFDHAKETWWYKILADGSYVTGDYDLKEIEAEFQRLKDNPTLLKKYVKVLKSEEISLPL